MLFSHTGHKSNRVCNFLIQARSRITKWITETNHNEPCDNAFQATLDLFLLKQWGQFLAFGGMSERQTGSQQPETSPCFSTHPHKRIGHNGVSSSMAPSAPQINWRKLPTKSKECYSRHILRSF